MVNFTVIPQNSKVINRRDSLVQGYHMRSYGMDPSDTVLPWTCGKLVTEVSLSTRRYQVASITQNNHIYEDLVEYFRSKVLLNLWSQVNIQNTSTTSTPSVYQPHVKQLPHSLRIPLQIQSL